MSFEKDGVPANAGTPLELVQCRLGLVVCQTATASLGIVADRLGRVGESYPAVMHLRMIHSGTYGNSLVIGGGAVCDVPLRAQYQRKNDHQQPKTESEVKKHQPQRNCNSHLTFDDVADFCCVFVVAVCIHDCLSLLCLRSQFRTKDTRSSLPATSYLFLAEIG